MERKCKKKVEEEDITENKKKILGLRKGETLKSNSCEMILKNI